MIPKNLKKHRFTNKGLVEVMLTKPSVFEPQTVLSESFNVNTECTYCDQNFIRHDNYISLTIPDLQQFKLTMQYLSCRFDIVCGRHSCYGCIITDVDVPNQKINIKIDFYTLEP